MDGRFVSYLRVSTQKQGESGLGLAAQRASVIQYLNGGDWKLMGEYVEVESGKNNDRPELAKALDLCRRTKSTLLVAKLDRLTRNARFLLSVVEGSGENGVVFCDLPQLPPGPVGKFLITQMAAVAELEAGLISDRTRKALAQAKARGVKLGGYHGVVPDTMKAADARQKAAEARAADLGPMMQEMRGQGWSLAKIAAEMTSKSICTPRGGAWTADTVKRILDRISN